MSFSEVIVLKFLGEKAASVCSFIESTGSEIEKSPSQKSKNTNSKDLHLFLNNISKNCKDVSLIYSSRYFDNDSVNGSHIKNMWELLELVEGVKVKEVTAAKYFVLLLKFNKNFDLNELAKLKRLKRIAFQPSERRLHFNIYEACSTWEKFNESSVVLVISKTLGSTISDEIILNMVENCNRKQ